MEWNYSQSNSEVKTETKPLSDDPLSRRVSNELAELRQLASQLVEVSRTLEEDQSSLNWYVSRSVVFITGIGIGLMAPCAVSFWMRLAKSSF